MKLTIDSEANAVYLKIKEGKISRTQKITKRVNLDLDESEEVLGIEIYNVLRNNDVINLCNDDYKVSLTLGDCYIVEPSKANDPASWIRIIDDTGEAYLFHEKNFEIYWE